MFNNRIHYVTVGFEKGRTPLILLMGYSGSVPSWTYSFLSKLGSRWPVIAIDIVGTGKSQKQGISPMDLTYLATVKDITDLLSHLSINQAHILGYSYGGTIALSAANYAPGYCTSLLLVSTILGGKSYVTPPITTLKELAVPPGSTLEEKSAAIWRLCLGNDKFEFYRSIMDAVVSNTKKDISPGWILQQHLHNYLNFDFTQDAASLSLPVTIITGDQDPLTPPQNSLALEKAIPHANLIMIPGCRHMPHIEATDQYIDHILNHLHQAELHH